VDLQTQGVHLARSLETPVEPTRFFVLGSSNSGKTPFARHLAGALGLPVVSASEWFRANFPPQGSTSRQEHTDALVQFNNTVMGADPDFNLRYLREHHDLNAACVIEGFRNPRDFAIEFNARRDRAILLQCEETEIIPTSFDKGLTVIRDYLAYLQSIGMVRADQVTHVNMKRFADIERSVFDYLRSLDVEVELDLLRAKTALGAHSTHYYPDPEQFPDPGEGATGTVIVVRGSQRYPARFVRRPGAYEGRSFYLVLDASNPVPNEKTP